MPVVNEDFVALYLDGRLPPDEYALVEAYCPDPTCDCRRVMINVVGRQQMARGFLAVIGFGFDRRAVNAGPYLDPLNFQSEYAPQLFDLVVIHALSQPDYVARLKVHYAQIKQVASTPGHPQRRLLREATRGMDIPMERPSRRGRSRKRRR